MTKAFRSLQISQRLTLLIAVLALSGMAALAVGKVIPEFPTVLGFHDVGMAPVQPIADIVGATTKTDGNSTTVRLELHSFSFTLNKLDAMQDGAKISLPMAPFSYAGISYVPLRALLTALGGTLAAGADPLTLDVTLPGIPLLHAILINQDGKPQDLQKTNSELFLVKTDGSPAQQLTYCMAEEWYANFSPDGTTLLYNRDADICQRQLDLPFFNNLTETFSKEHIMSVNPTPNGNGTIWFMQVDTKKQQDAAYIPSICQMKLDGSAYKRVIDGIDPHLSTDGKIIAYYTTDKDQKRSIHVMNADGVNDHVVAEGLLQALSPDGTIAVYVNPPTKQGEIATMAAVNASTGKEFFGVLKDAKANEGFPCFSPDGKLLAYLQENGGMWIMNADRSNAKQLDKDPMDGPAKFSPDGSKIAFTRNGNLFLMNVDGSDIKPLAPGLLIRDFSFSPIDGTQIAVSGMTEAAMKAANPTPAGQATPAADKPHDTRGKHEAPNQEEIDAAKAAGTQHAVIKTEKGDITVELNGADAPLTVANFVKLTNAAFYNGLTFHRVEADFVIQGGDPDGDGSGGPGYSIKLEIAPNLKHIEGALAMARATDPDSAGSQFYITLAATPDLDSHYAVFGKVIKGMDVVKKIAKGDKIISITITKE